MKYLVTSALPYANGPIHLGHIAGAYLPADIYVRSLKNKEEEVLYICGTDEHGVAITINAESMGVTPKDVVTKNHETIDKAFKMMNMSFDIFSGTHNETHSKLSQDFFLKLKSNGYISEKEVEQFYCEHDEQFLPDRYVEGTCPICKNPDARGDQCEKCGHSLHSLDLKEPKCKICGRTPAQKVSNHWFLDLDKFQDKLKKWLASKTDWKPNVKAFCEQWFERGLEPRGITRDLSWGVPIPIEGADGKVLYVWFDAPIGYISFTIEYLKNMGKEDEWESWWKGGDDVKLVHFIGKDNIVFHSIIWPAMLMGQEDGFKLPDEIPANEFLNLEGDKFSTSKNYAIWVHEFLEKFPSDVARYYLAQIAPEAKDADFSYKGFQLANNSELAGIYGNFVNRTLTFVAKYFKGKIKDDVEMNEDDDKLWEDVKTQLDIITDCYENFKVRDVVFHIMELGRVANRYFDSQQPWATRKTNPARCKTTLLNCLNLIDTIATISEPILPESSRKVKEMLNLPEDFRLTTIFDQQVTEGHKIGKPEILFAKIDDDVINAEKETLGL